VRKGERERDREREKKKEREREVSMRCNKKYTLLLFVFGDSLSCNMQIWTNKISKQNNKTRTRNRAITQYNRYAKHTIASVEMVSIMKFECARRASLKQQSHKNSDNI
jgi:hypothetical protein